MSNLVKPIYFRPGGPMTPLITSYNCFLGPPGVEVILFGDGDVGMGCAEAFFFVGHFFLNEKQFD